MNISDQNVYALDTAFLRRWDREYVYADTWEGVHDMEKLNYQITNQSCGKNSQRL